MKYLLLALSIFAIYHFIYNGILLPSIRWHLRNRLFELRDSLRTVMIEEGAGCDEDAFHFLHDGINNFLPRLHLLNISFKVSVEHKFEDDENFRNRAERRRAIIENCDNAQFKEIYSEVNQTIESAFIANMGGWYIYVVPVVLVGASISKLSELASELISVNSYDANKLAPMSREMLA